jgi:hypothetical protein
MIQLLQALTVGLEVYIDTFTGHTHRVLINVVL